MNNKKILIVQTAFAGDVILCTPMAEAIKTMWPGSEVSFLATPDTGMVLKNNRWIDRILLYDKRGKERHLLHLIRQIRQIREAGFDIAAVPHRSFRSAVLVWAARIPCRIGFDISAAHGLFTETVPYNSAIHEIERNISLLEPLGWKGEIPAPVLYPDHEEKQEVRVFLEQQGLDPASGIIALAPGSVWPTKRWPAQLYAETAALLWEKYRMKSVCIGGSADASLGDRIVSGAGPAAVSAMGKLSIMASAELIGQCRLLISNDSAPLHLAVSVGTPVIAIFGPTSPSFGFYPWGEGHTVLYKDIVCSPCGIHGGVSCPRKHFSCMNSITPGEVLESVRRYMP